MRTPQGTGDENLDRVVGDDSFGNEDDLAVLDGSNAEIGLPQNVSNEDLDTDLSEHIEDEEEDDRL